MQLRNLAVTAVLFAGSLQASILYNQMSGLGLAPGPNSILQDFSNPTSPTSQQTSIAPTGTTGALFSDLTLTANTNLYYDPNGAAGCSLGKGFVPGSGGAPPSLANLTACVGNYDLGLPGTPAGSNESYPQTSLMGFLPDLSINFNNNVSATSFLFAAPGGAAGVANTEIDVFNGTQKIDSLTFRSQLMSGSYIVINENQSFNEVVITQLDPTKSESGMNTTFNALIGDVEATEAPEPGTIGLLGFGLAGVGYFARRRKS